MHIEATQGRDTAISSERCSKNDVGEEVCHANGNSVSMH